VACLTDTLPELTCFLRFPREHWARIRHTNLHTNLPERTFGEPRRRVKVIGRLPGERSCLSLVWAVLDRASRGWRGVVMTPAAVRLLQELRRQLHHPSRLEEEVVDQTVTPAASYPSSGARVCLLFHHQRDATRWRALTVIVRCGPTGRNPDVAPMWPQRSRAWKALPIRVQSEKTEARWRAEVRVTAR
jgi:hypothetical protein